MPVAPIAFTAVRIALAGTAIALAARSLPRAARDQRADDAMDDLSEGAFLAHDQSGARGTLRVRRVIRLGQAGPGVELNFCGLARLTLRRVS